MTKLNQTTTLEDWQAVEEFLDASDLKITPSYLDRVNSRQYPKDAFTLGQLVSKGWLLNELNKVSEFPSKDAVLIAILGSWVATLVHPLLDSLREKRTDATISRVYGFDADPKAVELSDQFNVRLVQQDWLYKGVVADCSILECNDMQFEVAGQLIECKPDIIINTSCEHMSTEWFNTCDSDQLVVMQTNDSPDYEGHINTCTDLAEMHSKYPMTKRLYSGALITPAYTRFMQIGYR